MENPSKYAYFVVNDSDDLEELQLCLIPFGGVEKMKDVIIDYALDKRRIIDLIKCCNKRDIIYTPYLARLGKSLKELYQIVGIANKYEVNLIFCDKLNVSFSDTDLNGKINLASLQWAVDLDFAIRSEYNKAHVAKRRDLIERKGSFIIESGPKAGETCTYVGSPKVKDMSEAQLSSLAAANEASAKARTDAAILWREQSQAVAFVRRKRAEGWGVTQIAVELGHLYDENAQTDSDTPNPYGTPSGCKPSKGTVSKWLKAAQYQPISTLPE